MAPRSGPRVKVISPNSGTVTMSRSVSLVSSSSSGPAPYQHSSGHASPVTASLLRSGSRFHRASATATAHTAPQTSRSVLCPVGVNTSNSSIRSAGGKSTLFAKNTRNATASADAKAEVLSRRAALPNYFDSVAVARPESPRNAEPRLATASASRSHSRSFHDQTSLMSGRHGASAAAASPASSASRRASARRHTEEEDDAAVRRATAALEQAGGAVLRRPFGATRAAGNTSALPLPTPDAPPMPSQERRGLCLPSSIPHTAATHARCDGCRRPRSEDGGDVYDEDDTEGTESGYSSRSRTRADASTLSQPPPARSFFAAAAAGAAPSVAAAPPPPPPPRPRVCPGMFAGLSAVPLDERLFACDTLQGTPARVQAAGGAPAGGVDTQQQQKRYCVHPLWSLVGTFKTSLSGLVTVDRHQECLRWSQRNPKGGQQLIKVPLSAVLDVFTTGVVQEDEQVEEKQFTVVVRTSTRPSQVVFGFATTTEANHLRNILKRR